MSFEGIQQAAAVFSLMQQTRLKLLGGDNQDIRLGQMLDVGKDAMKVTFEKITAEPKLIHPCKCTDYNDGQCYNCLNGFHEGCTGHRKCGKKNAKHLGIRLTFRGEKITKKR